MTELRLDKLMKMIVSIMVITLACIGPLTDVFSAETETQTASDQETKFNRLIHESSPYLLLHAANPINWFPWGKEAFEKAKRDDKPIFLSIGYSTCHWCHVMERESFSDKEVAELLNKDFISHQSRSRRTARH